MSDPILTQAIDNTRAQAKANPTDLDRVCGELETAHAKYWVNAERAASDDRLSETYRAKLAEKSEAEFRAIAERRDYFLNAVDSETAELDDAERKLSTGLDRFAMDAEQWRAVAERESIVRAQIADWQNRDAGLIVEAYRDAVERKDAPTAYLLGLLGDAALAKDARHKTVRQKLGDAVRAATASDPKRMAAIQTRRKELHSIKERLQAVRSKAELAARQADLRMRFRIA